MSLHTVLASAGLAVALSIDGILVGAAYACRRIHIPLTSLLLITFVTSALMYVSMASARILSAAISAKAAESWGSLIMLGLGVWLLWRSLERQIRSAARRSVEGYPQSVPHGGNQRNCHQPVGINKSAKNNIVAVIREPLAADQDSSGVIDARESAILGIALGLDAFLAGFAASLSGFSLWLILWTSLACFGFLKLGCFAADLVCTRRTRTAWYLAPGVLLIAVSVLRMIAAR